MIREIILDTYEDPFSQVLEYVKDSKTPIYLKKKDEMTYEISNEPFEE